MNPDASWCSAVCVTSCSSGRRHYGAIIQLANGAVLTLEMQCNLLSVDFFNRCMLTHFDVVYKPFPFKTSMVRTDYMYLMYLIAW